MKKRFTIFLAFFVLFSLKVQAQATAPLKLIQTIPIPGLKDGDFDHFAVDLKGHRLFLTAETNSVVEVFDLRTNKLIHTITDATAPHSMVYRADLQELFVVDGGNWFLKKIFGAAEVKIFDGDSYKYVGGIKLKDDADSMTYDPVTKYMYVVNGGSAVHEPYSLISIIDTTAAKKLADIKVDTDSAEGLALEKSGPRLFVNLSGLNAVGVIDREKHTLLTTWSIAREGEENTPLVFDEADHRLFTVIHKPAKLIALDSDSGRVVASVPCADRADDMAYDPGTRRLYISGAEFVDVFQQKDADHYEQVGHIPTGVRAKTAILVPQLKRYYVAEPRHGDKEAEVRVYQVAPHE